MMKNLWISLALLIGLGASPLLAQGQDSCEKKCEKTKKEEYQFTVVKALPITSIKDQSRTGTCWSFSGIGFLESELLRMGKQPIELSEMFVVSHSYKDKALSYLRRDGNTNFAEGGSFADVLYVLKHYGAVPASLMTGLHYGTKSHVHSEMERGAKAFLDAIVKRPNRRISTAWKKAYDGIIDAYLGQAPEQFSYNGKSFSPKSFAQYLGLNADDYVSITSFTHHPFYSQFVLEIADNWRQTLSYNLPFEEMMQTIDNAIEHNYPVAWGTDVSEMGFTRDGLAILIDAEAAESAGSDQARWVGVSAHEKNQMIRDMIKYINAPEIKVTQAFRQEGYDNKTTTDDHGMMIYGIAKDQTGKKFYMVKNSWGEAGKYKGIWYASSDFVAGKTMNIVVHKNAIPAAIRAKLGIR